MKRKERHEAYITGRGPVDRNGVFTNPVTTPEVIKDGPLLQQFLQIVKLLSEDGEHVDGVKPNAK